MMWSLTSHILTFCILLSDRDRQNRSRKWFPSRLVEVSRRALTPQCPRPPVE